MSSEASWEQMEIAPQICSLHSMCIVRTLSPPKAQDVLTRPHLIVSPRNDAGKVGLLSRVVLSV